MFNKVHALLLVRTRILPPPIFRRKSGGISAGFPAASRRDVRRMIGVTSATVSAEWPAKLPGKLRSNAGKLSDGFQAFARQMVGKLPPQYRRTSGGNTGTVAGQSPVTFPSYAWR
jgi:hypothetical protein